MEKFKGIEVDTHFSSENPTLLNWSPTFTSFNKEQERGKQIDTKS